MHFIRIIATTILCLFAAQAHAYTSCASTLTQVISDVGLTSGNEHGYGRTVAGVGFDIHSGMVVYKTVMALATTAYATSASVNLVFAADGVNCSTFVYRTDLLQITLY